MKLIITVSIAVLIMGSSAICQKITGKLKFTQGQVIEITMNVKTKIAQEAMGQAIDFDVNGLATHLYTVTNTTEDNSTLHHAMKRISYSFDGMGQKKTIDSDKPKDMGDQFGKPIKDMLDKTYDMAVDSTGKVMMVLPEKIEISNTDPTMMLIMNNLKDLVSTVQPPKKNEASFFKLLPDAAAGIGESWAETTNTETGKSTTNYKIADINDSTVVIEFSGLSATTSKAEMMGMETTTTMNNKTSGKIILDKATGLIRQKSSTIDSNGTTEVMGGSLPVTSKTTIEITVRSRM